MICQRCIEAKFRHAEAFTYNFPQYGVRRTWLIDRAMETVELLHLPTIKLDLRCMTDWFETRVEIDERHLTHVDMSLPAIILTIEDGSSIVLDGNHRLCRAMREGREHFPVFRLTIEQLPPVLVYSLSA